MRKIHTRKRTTKGVAALEFIIVAFFLYALVDGIIFFGILFYRYNLLSDAVTSTLRAITVNVNLEGDNDNYSPGSLVTRSSLSSIPIQIEKYITENYTSNISQLHFDSITVCKDTSTGLCRMKVAARWDVSCFFCAMFDHNESAKIEVTSGFEDPCFLTEATGCDSLALGDCV